MKRLIADHNNHEGIDHASSSDHNHSADNKGNDRTNNNQEEKSKEEEEGKQEEGVGEEEETKPIGDGAETEERPEKEKWSKEATCNSRNLSWNSTICVKLPQGLFLTLISPLVTKIQLPLFNLMLSIFHGHPMIDRAMKERRCIFLLFLIFTPH